MRTKKPTDKQRLYLEDLDAGRDPWHRARGMSQHGGMDSTARSCIRAGWCDDYKTINPAGRAALAST